MTNHSAPARVRFAPSPTGRIHLGGARTALYNFLLARQTGGQMILRWEDTDRKRYQPETEQEIIDSLSWLGIEWDEGPDVGGPYGPYRQSERKALYLEYAGQLMESGHAYPCFCTPDRLQQLRQAQQQERKQAQYDGHCRSISRAAAQARADRGERHVIRFKMPREGSITVTDAIRGDITVENKSLDDYIIVKSDGLALYHLAVVVDDHLMNVTHVFRTSEWLPTFPLHGHIYRALGWEEPIWIHPSIFLKPSGKGKMSKRESAQMMKSGKSIFPGDLEEIGYLPEAVVNWIALMGWAYDDHTEFFSMADLIQKFNINRLNPSPAAINFSKLDHFNGLHIRALSSADLASRLVPFFQKAGYDVSLDQVLPVAPLLQPRLVTLGDAARIAGFFFEKSVTPNPQGLIGRKMSAGESLAALKQAHEILSSLPDFKIETTEPPMRALAEDLGLKAGQLFGILRMAVTGQTVSPPLFESMALIGKEISLTRMAQAREILKTVVAELEG